MLFCQVEGMLINHDASQEDSRQQQRGVARNIQLKTEDFSRKQAQDSFYFVSEITDGLINVGILANRRDEIEDSLRSYMQFIDCHPDALTIAEVTFGRITQLLRRAERNHFISDLEDILEKYNLDKLFDRHLEFGDNILEEHSRKEIFHRAEHYLFNETFLPELQRIYQCPATGKIYGHPVHYMIQTDDPDTRRNIFRLLLQALYANGRLMSRRYSFLDFRPGDGFSAMAFHHLYDICAGGTVIVRYLANDDSEDDGFASGEQNTIEKICQVVKQHSNRVLTILCLPKECKKAKAIFYENLGHMTFVELQEDFADPERSKAFLKMLAKEQHIRTDKRLFSMLEDGKSFMASELRNMFEQWYNHKLKTSVFPQYQALSVAGKKVAKAAPRGSAYDELQSMIGLKEAKAVIQKALNYYKIQKLYEDRGIHKDHPAMHMVFTGNPGTAKTTTARLFARIMKDNGLLSKGQLVEVGRGDLVGKYVGWTAKTVQAKFKAAMGGVLFIDEAYSLVDGHSGSYGDEAINTIVQEMENHREDVVVIFAGYPKEMEQFLQRNPGLRSRIAFHVPFADYTAQELCQIAVLTGKHKGIVLEEAALNKLEDIFSEVCKKEDFGNGRYVRNVLEQAKMNQASRLLALDFDAITTEIIQTITAADIATPETQAPPTRTIGFAC